MRLCQVCDERIGDGMYRTYYKDGDESTPVLYEHDRCHYEANFNLSGIAIRSMSRPRLVNDPAVGDLLAEFQRNARGG